MNQIEVYRPPTGNSASAQREKLLAKRQEYLAALQRAVEANRQKKITRCMIRIQRTVALLKLFDDLGAAKVTPPTGRRYAVSSWFLHESFRKLTADQDEQLFFVTGTEVENTLVLDQWVELVHEKRTFVGVTAEMTLSHRLLIKLEQFGHKLLASFHSHPGKGAGSTSPSGIDTAFQTRLEAGGHIAAMAIFSRDGFVRFLRIDDTCEVQIYGEGVENHGRNLFRLTQVD